MTSSFRYRPELDGLRAVAVLSVLIYHLNPTWMPGGYLGVDVFFVMSGYLITSLLVLEFRQSNRIDLARFWSRRVRRLMPAFVAMVVTVAMYYYAFAPEIERIGLRGDLIASQFYAANWRFIESGQSYFEQYVGLSPVRHAWSLAIEEQFYLVWPLLAFAFLRWFRSITTGIITVICVALSALTMWVLFDPANPSRAYYGSFARFHQILIGVLLALVLLGPAARHVKRVCRLVLPITGGALLAALVVLSDDASLYYRGGALMVAVCAAMLIAGLEGGHRAVSWLSWRPLVMIGVVSYGLYLWHWPVIRAIEMELGPTSRLANAVTAVAITAAITFCSYVVLERPIRAGSSIFGRPATPRVVLLSVPLVSIVTLALVIPLTSVAPQPEWATGVAVDAGPSPSLGSQPPTQGQQGSGGASPADPPSRSLGVVGDSVMYSLLPGLRSRAAADGFALLEASVPACPIGFAPLWVDADVQSQFYVEQCRDRVRPGYKAMLAMEPDVIIWHDLQSTLSRRSADGTFLSAGSPQWTTDLVAEWTKVLDSFLAVGARVVLLMPPLRSQDDVGGCGESELPERCRQIQDQDQLIRDATQRFWDQVGDRPGVQTLAIDDLLCPGGNPCPTRIDNILVRLDGYDQTHLTEEGADWLAGRLLDRIPGFERRP